MCVIGYAISLTLIGCDSRVVILNWFDGLSGDWRAKWFDLLIELGSVQVLLHGYHVVVLS